MSYDWKNIRFSRNWNLIGKIKFVRDQDTFMIVALVQKKHEILTHLN